MAKYHKYVFDQDKRRLVGAFEDMYAAEDKEGFDSWQSNDVRALRLRLAMELLKDYNFASVLEVGCGKGTASQFLKKANNRVVGIDISPTAVKKAQASFPDIEFSVMQAMDVDQLNETFELVTVMTVLAYIEDWRDVLSKLAGMTAFCMVVEYIPENPIGMVKSPDELQEAFSQHFDIITKLMINDEGCILFGKRRS